MSLDTGVPPINIPMKFHTLFPTVIGHTKIKECTFIKEKFASKIINRFKASSDEKAHWATLCNTWQINADEELNQLFTDYLEKHVHSWFEEFCFPKIEYNVFSWVNVHTWESYQETHYHMGDHCILCGIYNLQLNEKDRPAIFINEVPDYQDVLCQENIKAEHDSLKDDSRKIINITEGDLVLFSPHQKHCVPCASEKHDGYRITISFNVCKRYG